MRLPKFSPCLFLAAAGLTILLTSSCETGKVHTVSYQNAESFPYSLPETVIKIRIPVKCIMVQTGRFPIGVISVDDSAIGATPLLAIDFDAYPGTLSMLIRDQANNATSLEKFDVKYHTRGNEASTRSIGTIESINSSASDKTGSIINNATQAAFQVARLATGMSGFLQIAAADVVIYTDQIEASGPLRNGYGSINKSLSLELSRIRAAVNATEKGREINDFRGIQWLSVGGKASGWKANGGPEYLITKIADRLSSEGYPENKSVARKGTSYVNGIVYTEPKEATFKLSVGFLPMDGKPTTKVISATDEIPEAGTLKLLPVNPKSFETRTLSATFARNGALLSWGFGASSRADNITAFMKDETSSINTGATEVMKQVRTNEVAAATTRANVVKLSGLISAKQGELELAIRTEEKAMQANAAAQVALANANDEQRPALQTAADKSELDLIKAQNATEILRNEIKSHLDKADAVASGLLAP
jgi:hypothetical protein